MSDTLWVVIASGTLAGIGAGITNQIFKSKFEKNQKLRMFMVIFVVTLSMSFAKELPNPFLSREQKALKKMGDQLMTAPGVKEKLEKIPDVEKKYGRKLSSAGLQRLDDESLLRLFGIKFTIINSLDEEKCASIGRGEPTLDTYELLRPLSDEELEEYIHITFNAMLAELNEEPPKISVDENAWNKAFEDFLSEITPEDASKYSEVSNNTENASDQDICWAQKLIYSKVPLLEENDRKIWARIMINT